MINTILSILAALGLFLFIIFIHELGHFLAAKWSKIRVSEFAIGMGPKIFSWGKGETQYSIRAIPIGGFCAMQEDEGADENDERAFRNKPVHKRFITIAAGGIFNILLGFILMFTFVTIQTEYDTTALESPIRVAEVDFFAWWQNTENDGLQIGDRITHVNGTRIFVASDIFVAVARQGPENPQTFRINRDGERIEIETMLGRPIETNIEWRNESTLNGLHEGDRITHVNGERILDINDIYDQIAKRGTSAIQTFRVIRNDEIVEVETALYNDWQENFYEHEPTYHPPRIDFQMAGEGKNPWTIARDATGQTVSMVRWIYVSLLDLVTGNVDTEEIAGPVGVIDQTAQAAREGGGMLLFWMGILSINLGVLNLLPIPALDGARLVFLGIEGIRRKPIKPEREGVVHLVGFIVLIGLILLLTFNDIIRIFGG